MSAAVRAAIEAWRPLYLAKILHTHTQQASRDVWTCGCSHDITQFTLVRARALHEDTRINYVEVAEVT